MDFEELHGLHGQKSWRMVVLIDIHSNWLAYPIRPSIHPYLIAYCTMHYKQCTSVRLEPVDWSQWKSENWMLFAVLENKWQQQVRNIKTSQFKICQSGNAAVAMSGAACRFGGWRRISTCISFEERNKDIRCEVRMLKQSNAATLASVVLSNLDWTSRTLHMLGLTSIQDPCGRNYVTRYCYIAWNCSRCLELLISRSGWCLISSNFHTAFWALWVNWVNRSQDQKGLCCHMFLLQGFHCAGLWMLRVAVGCSRLGLQLRRSRVVMIVWGAPGRVGSLWSCHLPMSFSWTMAHSSRGRTCSKPATMSNADFQKLEGLVSLVAYKTRDWNGRKRSND